MSLHDRIQASANTLMPKPIDLVATMVPMLPGYDDQTLGVILCQVIEDGPRGLIGPINAEFAKRGVDPASLGIVM